MKYSVAVDNEDNLSLATVKVYKISEYQEAFWNCFGLIPSKRGCPSENEWVRALASLVLRILLQVLLYSTSFSSIAVATLRVLNI